MLSHRAPHTPKQTLRPHHPCRERPLPPALGPAELARHTFTSSTSHRMLTYHVPKPRTHPTTKQTTYHLHSALLNWPAGSCTAGAPHHNTSQAAVSPRTPYPSPNPQPSTPSTSCTRACLNWPAESCTAGASQHMLSRSVPPHPSPTTKHHLLPPAFKGCTSAAGGTRPNLHGRVPDPSNPTPN